MVLTNIHHRGTLHNDPTPTTDCQRLRTEHLWIELLIKTHLNIWPHSNLAIFLHISGLFTSSMSLSLMSRLFSLSSHDIQAQQVGTAWNLARDGKVKLNIMKPWFCGFLTELLNRDFCLPFLLLKSELLWWPEYWIDVLFCRHLCNHLKDATKSMPALVWLILLLFKIVHFN